MKKILLSLLVGASMLLGTANVAQAQAFKFWRERNAADCTTLTNGSYYDLCRNTGSPYLLYQCKNPSGCTTSADWALSGSRPAGSSGELQTNASGLMGAVTGSGSDANGNLGLGSTAPGAKLDVSGTVRATSFVSNGTGPGLLSSDTGTGLAFDPANSGAPAMIMTAAGNVGVGTVTPLDYLHVASATSGGITLDSTSGSTLDANTLMLAHFNGNTTDSSSNAITLTNGGAVGFTNSSPKFTGTYYALFTGGVTSYLSIGSSLLNFGSSDFTIDFWMKMSVLPTSGQYYVIFDKTDNGPQNGCYIGINNPSGTVNFLTQCFNGSTTPYVSLLNAPSMSTNTWYHIAFVHNGTDYRFYINGTSVANATSATNPGSVSTTGYIGAHNFAGSPNNWYPGSLSEFRISNTARWTTTFTPESSPYGSSTGLTKMTFKGSGATKGFIQVNPTNASNFELGNGSSTLLYLSQGGNVGVGTITPGKPLDVVGGLRVNNVIGLTSEYSAGNIGVGTTNINWNNGNRQNVGVNTTQGSYVSFTAPTAIGAANLQLRLTQGSNGNGVVQFWPSTVKWAAGAAPTLTTTATTGTDIVNCFWNGTNYWCNSSADFR